MNKTRLVALREYLENLRTKTFWIGILSFPVILVLFLVVPMWLDKARGVRKYAVLDRSGWLLEAVEQRAAAADVELLLRAMRSRVRGGGDLSAFPAALRGLAPALGDLSDEEIAGIAAGAGALLGTGSTGDGTAGPGLEAAATPEEARALQEALLQYYTALPPEEARRVEANLKRARYQRIAVEETGEEAAGRLARMLEGGDLFAWFEIGPDPVAGNQGNRYVSNNLTDLDLKQWFLSMAAEEVRQRRLARHEIPQEVARSILEPVEFEARRVDVTGEVAAVVARDRFRQWAPAAFVYLLFVALITVAQMLLTNTVEEKSNRTIEVLLSSVSPMQLMAGKIAGIAASGLTVVGFWVFFLFLGIRFGPELLGTGGGGIARDLAFIVRDPVYLASFLAYFFLGYLLYAAVMVGMGSVCTSLKEAQNLLQPVFVLIIVPLLAMVPISRDPNGALAKVLSWIPPFTPFVMMNRAAGPPRLWEYLGTTALLVFAIAVSLWAAAKVFRIGILMTGKPPRLGEILQWVRAPVGSLPSHAVPEEEPS